jgi:hypothetical protein
MIYVCNLCGHIKDEKDLKTVVEAHGEKHLDYTCDCCHRGEYVEATKCSVCGELFDNTELHGVCEGCLEKYETVGVALEIGEDCPESVEINGFIAKVLSKEHIGKILTKWVEENFVDHGKPVVDFLEADKSQFSEYVENREKENI